MGKEDIKWLFDKVWNLFIILVVAEVSVGFNYGLEKKLWLLSGVFLILLLAIALSWMLYKIKREE